MAKWVTHLPTNTEDVGSNAGYLRAWAVLVQSVGLNSPLSPVVYIEIALSIKAQ